ncbi:MAG: hypothetical protein WCT85_03040 [Parachlamydiales bacterium]|jgi:hypothetical protein
MSNLEIDAVNNNTVNNDIINKALLSQMVNTDALKSKDKDDINVKNCSYVFVVISKLNEIGIEKSSKILAAIAQVQKILDEIITDLSQLKNLLQQLQNIDWGKGPDGKDWGDPKDHSDADNQAQMARIIGGYTDIHGVHHDGWLQQKTTNPFTGKDCTNLELLQAYWADLFHAPSTGGEGLLYQLQDALNNPDFPQKSGSAITFLKDLNDPEKFFGAKGDWVNGSESFLDVLNGKVNEKQITYIANIMAKGFTYSWYSRTGQGPKGDTKTYNDDVGDITNEFEQTKGGLNGLNSTQSSNLSMYSQNLTSYIQEGQQMIQNGSQETKAYVSNQKGQ